MNEPAASVFEAIVRHHPEGLFLTDGGHRIVYANAAMCRIAGLPAANLVGRHVLEGFGEETVAHFRTHYLAAVASGRPTEFRCPVVTPVGRASWQGGWLVPEGGPGAPGGMLVTVTDMTQLHETQAALAEREARLRESEARLKLAQDGATLGVWELDVATGTNWWSSECRRLYGLADDLEPHDAVWRGCVHPEDLAVIDAQWHGAIARREPFEVEFRVRRPDGGWRWLLSKGSAEYDASGRPRRLAGINLDITARKAMEDALKHSERRFHDIARASADWIWELDAAGRYTFASDGIADVLGYSGSEVLGRTPFELMPAAEAERVRARFADIIARGAPFRDLANLNVHKDGSLRHVQTNGVPILAADGALLGYRGLDRDITELVRNAEVLERYRTGLEDEVAARTAELAAANRELAARAAEIADLYDHAPCGYHSLDSEGRVTAVNETELAMLGYARGEFVGHRIDEFMTPASRALFATRFPALRQGARLHELEYEFVRQDGSVLPVVITPTVVYDSEGRIQCFRAAVTDSSERTARQRQIEEMQAELARRAEAAEVANRAKSAFLATMSHEIRTPLNGVLGMTALLRRGGVTAAQAEQLAKIEASGRHLVDLISDILDLSKIEAGRVELASEEFLLADLVRELHGMIAGPLAGKGLSFRLDVADAPVALRGDRGRLRQALLNYLGNAVKFTEHGSVTLRCRPLERDGDAVQLRFEVSDTGPGIAAADQARLFEAFVQIDSSPGRRFGGTGLGLAITRRIADLMGGEAGVTSAPGAGCTFWMTAHLHAVPAPGPVAAPAGGDAEDRMRREHAGRCVLLVEDEPINRDVARMLLEDVGLLVDTAEDGRAAVACSAARDYAAILMDLHMPELDGLEATALIRAQPGRRATPIVALTANAFAEDRERCLAAGMDGFLAKPLDPDRLFATLLEVLSAR